MSQFIKVMNKVLDSKYIIDGLARELTPAQILGLQACPASVECTEQPIIDETVDPPIETLKRTKLTIAEAIIDSLWKKGHFDIDNLSVKLQWKGDTKKIGVPTAIYESVVQTAEYIEGLGISTISADFIESNTEDLEVSAVLPEESDRAVPAAPLAAPSSWIIFVPFDTDDYTCHEPAGTDYFIDCFEVIREMVEDGIIMSASTKTVGKIPGAVIQIADTDFDYIDAEFLLQDVAYYPVGHPSEDGTLPNIEISHNSGIQKILSSLIQSRSTEGED